MSVPADRLRLYDEHASRLYALALRIVGDRDEAAAVLEEVFRGKGLPAELGGLMRITREISLKRYVQSARPPVAPTTREPSPRLIVEDAFYRGMSLADLAREWNLPVEIVRSMIADGMAALRKELGGKRDE